MIFKTESNFWHENTVTFIPTGKHRKFCTIETSICRPTFGTDMVLIDRKTFNREDISTVLISIVYKSCMFVFRFIPDTMTKLYTETNDSSVSQGTSVSGEEIPWTSQGWIQIIGCKIFYIFIIWITHEMFLLGLESEDPSIILVRSFVIHDRSTKYQQKTPHYRQSRVLLKLP